MKKLHEQTENHPKLHQWLLKAEKHYVKLLPVLTICFAAVNIVAALPTVEPIWHRCDADPLLLSKTPEPMDFCTVFSKIFRRNRYMPSTNFNGAN